MYSLMFIINNENPQLKIVRKPATDFSSEPDFMEQVHMHTIVSRFRVL